MHQSTSRRIPPKLLEVDSFLTDRELRMRNMDQRFPLHRITGRVDVEKGRPPSTYRLQNSVVVSSV